MHPVADLMVNSKDIREGEYIPHPSPHEEVWGNILVSLYPPPLPPPQEILPKVFVSPPLSSRKLLIPTGITCNKMFQIVSFKSTQICQIYVQVYVHISMSLYNEFQMKCIVKFQGDE